MKNDVIVKRVQILMEKLTNYSKKMMESFMFFYKRKWSLEDVSINLFNLYGNKFIKVQNDYEELYTIFTKFSI